MDRIAYARRGWLKGASVWALLMTLVGVAGCKGCEAPGQRRADPALALLPARAQTVVSLDLSQVRRSVLWKAVATAGQRSSDDLKILEGVKARTGFDPLVDVHRLVFAFPEDARANGEFALLAFGDHLDERRLVSYARDEAKARGFDLRQQEHAGQRLWVGSDEQTKRAGFFLNDHTFVLGGGGWAQQMAASVAQPPEALPTHAELSHLCARIGTGHAAWAVAVVPNATRTRLAGLPRFAAASNIARVAVTLDLKDGLAASLRAELSTKEDAQALAAEVNNYIREAKQSPKLLLMGIGPWLEGVAARAQGPNVTVSLQLNAGQAQAMADRLAALMQLMKR